jgi:hypothetical protein
LHGTAGYQQAHSQQRSEGTKSGSACGLIERINGWSSKSSIADGDPRSYHLFSGCPSYPGAVYFFDVEENIW